jgi:hypothetical protein
MAIIEQPHGRLVYDLRLAIYASALNIQLASFNV